MSKNLKMLEVPYKQLKIMFELAESYSLTQLSAKAFDDIKTLLDAHALLIKESEQAIIFERYVILNESRTKIKVAVPSSYDDDDGINIGTIVKLKGYERESSFVIVGLECHSAGEFELKLYDYNKSYKNG